MSEQVDVLVIGGGPVGAALARALSGHPVSVMVLEAKTSPASDPRVLALSHGSRLFLERIGAWQNVRNATPIETIHVSQKGGFGRTILRAEESGVPSLGHVAGYGEIHDALVEGLSPEVYVEGAKACEIDLSRGAVDFDYLGERRQICARLVVMAEGGKLVEQVEGIEVHRKDYGQWAVIGQVRTDRAHDNIAYERFTREGPVALLPFGEGFSLVWTATPEFAGALVEMEKGEFLQKLQDHFGSRAGRFVDCGKMSGFPLALRYCEPIVAERLALVGNAAQTLHPVSGQGLNLGLRDVAALSRSILDCRIEDIGLPGMLSAHAKSRRMDREGGIRFTDSLIRIFSNEIPLLDSGRGLGLAALDCLPPARKWFSRKMMFGLRPGRIL
ncbi:MAG: ubiquinone biosynthesis protein UbiH [Burkholderiales bacterium]|nr:ubiquinone biosynthesis protein UbiH [Burkholderiales bacterium]